MEFILLTAIGDGNELPFVAGWAIPASQSGSSGETTNGNNWCRGPGISVNGFIDALKSENIAYAGTRVGNRTPG